MQIGILKEQANYEKRVAATPETVKKYINLGCRVFVESKAGADSFYTDQAYKDAGATVEKSVDTIIKNTQMLLAVQASDHMNKLEKGSYALGMFNPFKNETLFKKLNKSGIIVFSMELIPRISRAQSMDVLSSQTNLAGYRAVIEGMNVLNRAMPMMMTAAGSIRPAKTVVLGAGVAGLQAIATAKRMGSQVFAFDVRPAVKEQVESLGATFIDVESDKNAETTGGYAKEMSADYKKRQQAKTAEALKEADLVITTALIPGKPAPTLISEDIVKEMKPGSVIVDMAIESGGNCPLTKLNKIEVYNNVMLVGYPNLPSRIAFDASALYARNLYSFFDLMWDKELKYFKPKWDDEIVHAAVVSGNNTPTHFKKESLK